MIFMDDIHAFFFFHPGHNFHWEIRETIIGMA